LGDSGSEYERKMTVKVTGRAYHVHLTHPTRDPDEHVLSSGLVLCQSGLSNSNANEHSYADVTGLRLQQCRMWTPRDQRIKFV
jgi:hypothetical protein